MSLFYGIFNLHKIYYKRKIMFFDPLWFYLKGLTVTLFVEVLLFAFIISKKPLHILTAVCFNVTTHISLHLFFRMMLLTGFGYNLPIWLLGEVLVLIVEGFLYWTSKLIPKISKAYFWAFIFNLSSIIVGWLINLLIA